MKSDSFIAQNRTKAGVKTLPSGVQYRILEAGSGPKPTQSSVVDLGSRRPVPLGPAPDHRTARAEDGWYEGEPGRNGGDA